MKLGKQPPRHDHRTLTYETYAASALQPPSRDVDNVQRFTDWLMLGNDRAGDCVWAGAAHETMLWLATAGIANPARLFTERTALADYTAVTGYDPRDASTDQGTVVLDALNYRRKTGVEDTHGQHHKIGAFIALEPGNHTHIREAVYLFDAVGIGIEFPESAMTQFNQGRPWSVVPGARIDGGHYVPVIGYDTRYLYVVTWGRAQKMTWGFLARYCDEAYAILSPEYLTASRSPEGLALGQLQQDLAAL